ncbi:hypothetical protein PR048_026143, partial [Dryococelus australis]
MRGIGGVMRDKRIDVLATSLHNRTHCSRTRNEGDRRRHESETGRRKRDWEREKERDGQTGPQVQHPGPDMQRNSSTRVRVHCPPAVAYGGFARMVRWAGATGGGGEDANVSEYCTSPPAVTQTQRSPRCFVHWLMPRRVASVTSHLAVWGSLLVTLLVCHWFRVVLGVSNKLSSNCKDTEISGSVWVMLSVALEAAVAERLARSPSHQGEPGSIPSRVTGFSQVGIVPGRCCITASITLAVKSRPNLFTHSFLLNSSETGLLTSSWLCRRAEDLPRRGRRGANPRPSGYRSATLPLSCEGRPPKELPRKFETICMSLSPRNSEDLNRMLSDHVNSSQNGSDFTFSQQPMEERRRLEYGEEIFDVEPSPRPRDQRFIATLASRLIATLTSQTELVQVCQRLVAGRPSVREQRYDVPPPLLSQMRESWIADWPRLRFAGQRCRCLHSRLKEFSRQDVSSVSDLGTCGRAAALSSNAVRTAQRRDTHIPIVTKNSKIQPISLLTVLSKMLELIINKKINNTLNTNQYGFIRSKSTEDTTNKVISIVHNSNNKYVIGINIYAIIKLSNKTIKYKVDRGCPQGSVLGPLWNLCFNDFLNLPQHIKIEKIAYADDYLIIIQRNNRRQIEELGHNVMIQTEQWLEHTDLKLAIDKTKIIIFKCTLLKRPPHIKTQQRKVLIICTKQYSTISFDTVGAGEPGGDHLVAPPWTGRRWEQSSTPSFYRKGKLRILNGFVLEVPVARLVGRGGENTEIVLEKLRRGQWDPLGSARWPLNSGRYPASLLVGRMALTGSGGGGGGSGEITGPWPWSFVMVD